MSSFLIVVSAVYYIVYRYFPGKLIALSENHVYYFGAFVFVYIVIWYMFSYEYSFIHKMFHNIYNSEQPLYSSKSATSNSSYYHKNSNESIKTLLLMKQGHRCYKCSNYIVDPENDTRLSYKILPKYGGKNDTHNLVMVCRTCSEFI
jgi:hypothetical protein